MRWLFGRALIIVVCMIGAGCGGSATPGEPTADDVPTYEASSGEPAPTTGTQPSPEPYDGGRTDNPGPPGVPGSPIDYDSTVRAAGPDSAQDEIESVLASKCGPNRCGVKVVIKGQGDCVPDIFPDPVYPRQTITIVAAPCPTEEPPTSDTTTPTTEDTTQTSSG
jgi:hypothetical protein